MIKESGKVTLFLEARVLKVKTEKNRVVSAVIESGGEKTTVTAKVFIDATETGDFIPLTGARYRCLLYTSKSPPNARSRTSSAAPPRWTL